MQIFKHTDIGVHIIQHFMSIPTNVATSIWLFVVNNKQVNFLLLADDEL